MVAPRIEIQLTDGVGQFSLAEVGQIILAVKEEVHWYNPENAQLCRIYVRIDADIDDREDWSNQQGWLLDRAEAFLAVFGPVVKSL